MGLNDEREKLRQAEMWLANPATPVQRESAREYVEWIAATSEDLALRNEAQRLRREYVVMMLCTSRFR